MTNTNIKPVIFGLLGTQLSIDEYKFFKANPPLGFILFTRNCQTAEQIIDLVKSLKECINRDNLIVLIDQEGGRVKRLSAPNFTSFPAAKIFADLADINLDLAIRAVYLNAILIGDDLLKLGINVNCAPVADLLYDNAHSIIGDRSYGNKPEQVSKLAQSMIYGLKDVGITPIVKHIPGHGRAKLDSHLALPKINTSLVRLLKTDFKVFKLLANCPAAMTAHLLYSKIDPILPATISKKVINLVRNELNFNGVIITDDLSMKALKMDLAESAKLSLEAGCDIILHCSGKLFDMQKVLSNIDYLSLKRTDYLLNKLVIKPKINLIDNDAIKNELSKIIDWQY